jgi:hypothetical protein
MDTDCLDLNPIDGSSRASDGPVCRVCPKTLIVIVLSLFGAASCQSMRPPTPPPSIAATRPPTAVPPTQEAPQTELCFETIQRSEYGPGGLGTTRFPTRTMTLFLVNAPQDIGQIAEWISPQARQALDELDYRQYFALGLFQGRQGSNLYGVTIHRVTRQAGRIVVHIYLFEPGQSAVAAIETSPFHLVRVKRDDLPALAGSLVLQARSATRTPVP